jgi:hypothetical protein
MRHERKGGVKTNKQFEEKGIRRLGTDLEEA